MTSRGDHPFKDAVPRADVATREAMSRHHAHQWKAAEDLKCCRDKRSDVATSGATNEDCKVLEWMSRQDHDVTTSHAIN